MQLERKNEKWELFKFHHYQTSCNLTNCCLTLVCIAEWANHISLPMFKPPGGPYTSVLILLIYLLWKKS